MGRADLLVSRGLQAKSRAAAQQRRPTKDSVKMRPLFLAAESFTGKVLPFRVFRGFKGFFQFIAPTAW